VINSSAWLTKLTLPTYRSPCRDPPPAQRTVETLGLGSLS
jgi:hypothetical protein